MAGDHGRRAFVLVVEPVSLPRGGGRVERRGVHRAAGAASGDASTSVTLKPSPAFPNEGDQLMDFRERFIIFIQTALLCGVCLTITSADGPRGCGAEPASD